MQESGCGGAREYLMVPPDLWGDHGYSLVSSDPPVSLKLQAVSGEATRFGVQPPSTPPYLQVALIYQ